MTGGEFPPTGSPGSLPAAVMVMVKAALTAGFTPSSARMVTG